MHDDGAMVVFAWKLVVTGQTNKWIFDQLTYLMGTMKMVFPMMMMMAAVVALRLVQNRERLKKLYTKKNLLVTLRINSKGQIIRDLRVEERQKTTFEIQSLFVKSCHSQTNTKFEKKKIQLPGKVNAYH